MLKDSAVIAVLFLLVTTSEVLRAESPPAAPVETEIHFADRHSPIAVERAARELFALTWIGEWEPRDFKRPGRWERLGKIRAALDNKDYAVALEDFKRYSLEKLRLCDGEGGFGVSVARMDPWSIGEPRWKWLHQPPVSDAQRDEILRKADDLLEGVAIGGRNVDGRISGATTASIGKPGSIDWRAASAAASRQGNEDWPWRVEAFNPLLRAYLLTGDRHYLDTWAAYADDWAINQHDGLPTIGIDMEDRWGNAWGAFELFRYLRGVSMIPGGIEAVPADTFARVTARLVREYLPLAVLYQRANMTNWTDVGVPQMVDLAFLFDEYRCAPILLRDALRELDLLIPLRHMPDGVDFDTTYGYWRQFLLGAQGTIDRLAARGAIPQGELPAWEQSWRSSFDDARWLGNLRDAMLTRTRYGLAHATPEGDTPIGGGRVGHRKENGAIYGLIAMVPEMLRDPGTAALVNFAEKGLAPPFTSECFPVSGMFYQRAGWKPGNPYLYMHCPPHLDGGSMGIRNPNAIGIAAYGADLLETGENGPYDPPHSPLRIDGREAYFANGVLHWGHRGVMGGGESGPQAWQDAPPWRWHDSSRFDLAEGEYSGGYGEKDHIAGVTHRRQAFFVRSANMWIIVDRLSSDARHTYALDWRLPIAPGKDTVFTPDQIVADEDRQMITTHREKDANVTLRHFSAQHLIFDHSEERSDPKNGYRTHDFLRIGESWTAAAGSGVIVTAILPRPVNGNDLSDVRSLTTPAMTGFEATLPMGGSVHFVAANTAPSKLSLGDLAAEAEALLVVDEPEGVRSGIVLGDRALRLREGVAESLAGADAEFVCTGEQLVSTAIHTPVGNVQIEPADRCAFLGSQQITLSCPTADTEIRYTTDGAAPTLLSSLYAGPFNIQRDTTVKARAFRKGVTEMPITMSCRLASLIARADFYGARAQPAVDAATVSGLHYEISTGRWQDLLLSPQIVPVSSSGEVDRLFAAPSIAPGTIYRVRYQGYLAVPTEGVYTFHAPSESYLMNIVSGYDLNVVVDGVQWYPATTRHALGSWSIALKQGKHRLEVTFADFRDPAVMKLDLPGMQPWIWNGGAVPALKLDGPGLKNGPIPANMLCHPPTALPADAEHH